MAAKKPIKPGKPAAVAHVRASHSQESVDTRRKVFVERWLVNGNNATEAAKWAGFSAATASAKGHTMLQDPRVKELIGDRAKQVLHDATLSTERWAREMAAIGHFDPGSMYDADGNLTPLHLLPEHVRRGISSVDVRELHAGKGEDRVVIGRQTKVQMHDKNTALANIGKHLGVFEQDNRQRVNAIQVNVVLKG